uniref:Uncharacterized protein n=1 Tax=Cannabis sativa TaxID=3483 RepID=A0A803QXI1_CANSA
MYFNKSIAIRHQWCLTSSRHVARCDWLAILLKSYYIKLYGTRYLVGPITILIHRRVLGTTGAL